MSNKALIIIDMQKGSFTEQTARYDAEGVVNRINELASMFRTAGLPVIFIQHDGTGSGDFEKNTHSWELLDDLQVEPTDFIVDKTANDIFYRSNFSTKLNDLSAHELYVTGCATDFCVESTVQSALTKDYDVTIVADGHTTADRPHMPAEKVIAHYNWVWQNMIPTKGGIKVKTLAEIKNESVSKITEH